MTMTTPNNDDDAALADALAKYRRGDLMGEQAYAIRALIDEVTRLAAEQKRAADAFERNMRRIDLCCEAEIKAIEASYAARVAEMARLQADRAT
jgi:hypothetical protein